MGYLKVVLYWVENGSISDASEHHYLVFFVSFQILCFTTAW